MHISHGREAAGRGPGAWSAMTPYLFPCTGELHESKPQPRADHGLIATSEMVLERDHYWTLRFDKQSSVRAQIDFAPTSTNTEAGVVKSQAMTPSSPSSARTTFK